MATPAGPRSGEWAIRPGEADDLDGLVALERAVFGADSYPRAKLSALIRGERNTLVLVVTREARVLACGIAQVAPLARIVPGPLARLATHAIDLHGTVRVGYLKSLAVERDVRRRGLGTAVTRARLEWLRSRRVRHVFAFAWPPGHFLALAEKLGFAALSEWPEKTFSDGSAATLCHLLLDGADSPHP
jgi:ribosomal protein S18 acetylase RimI-like enzyme